MKNRKFRFLSITVLILIISCLVALTGCGESQVSDIAVTNSNAPRLTYVQGQDLDLSGGKLTAIVDGQETSVPLNAEDVTVSGYDKNLLGKQTLTITYKGKTTTIEVNVVARMVAENYETDYFVDDSFNNSKGRLRITKDDGSVFTVNLNNPNVRVKSFNSETAGNATVTVGYSDGAGADYETSFTVRVYNIGEVKFTKPGKTAYSSHETEMDLAGGYFTVTAEGSETLSKFVPLTKDMYEGFNPGAATILNRNNPLPQTVIFTYAKETYEFPITITYSGVSIIKDCAEVLKDIDWTKESVTLTDDQEAAALDAITEYYKLSQSRKDLLDKETVELIVRPAAQYISELLKEETLKFADTFIIDESGNVLLVGNSYEQMQLDVNKLKNSSDRFNVYSNLLRQMKEEFKSMKMTGDVTVGDYIVVTTAEGMSTCVDVFEFLMSLHDTLKVVPDGWAVDDLEEYANDIDTAVHLILGSGFVGPNYNYVFEVIQNWRPQDDYFDIIYSYYCYIAQDGQDFIINDLWQNLPLPGRLQDWYMSLYYGVYEAQYMATNAEGSSYLYDTTNFMYRYFETLKIAAEIKSGDNELYKDIYDILGGDLVMDNNLRRMVGGYITHTGGMLNSESYQKLWSNYLTLVDLNYKGELNIETHSAEFEATFNALAELTPIDVFGFISSLKFLYEQAGGEFYAFDYSENANNMFIYLLANYYMNALPEDARPAFQQLLLAIESYANYCAFGAETDALDDFKNAIESINDSYQSLEDQDLFDSLLGECFAKYLNIYNALDNAPQLNSSWEAKVSELESTLNSYIDVVNYIADTDIEAQYRNSAIILLFALYERAEDMYGELLASDNDDVLAILYTKEYTIGETKATLDTWFYSARTIFISYMLNSTFTETDADGNEIVNLVWDIYSASDLDAFLVEASYVLQAGFENTSLDKATVDAIIIAFRDLGDLEKNIFYMIGVQLYYNSLEAFYHSVFEDDEQAKLLATAILEAEYAYYLYYAQNTDETREYFETQMTEAIDLYGSVSDFDMRDEYLSELYNYYLEKYLAIAEA